MKTLKRAFFRILGPLLIISPLVLGGLAYYFYQKFNSLKNNPNTITQGETETLVAEIGRIILLPENETPTVATVSDPAALKDQIFFTDAKKGYKVLIYTNAKKAILYDPVARKIINVAPINIGTTSEGNPVTIPDTKESSR